MYVYLWERKLRNVTVGLCALPHAHSGTDTHTHAPMCTQAPNTSQAWRQKSWRTVPNIYMGEKGREHRCYPKTQHTVSHCCNTFSSPLCLKHSVHAYMLLFKNFSSHWWQKKIPKLLRPISDLKRKGQTRRGSTYQRRGYTNNCVSGNVWKLDCHHDIFLTFIRSKMIIYADYCLFFFFFSFIEVSLTNVHCDGLIYACNVEGFLPHQVNKLIHHFTYLPALGFVFVFGQHTSVLLFYKQFHWYIQCYPL